MTRPRYEGVGACLWAALFALALPAEAHAETVTASWYGKAHHGRLTASGARFDMHGLSAAHRTMAFGTRLRVCRVYAGKPLGDANFPKPCAVVRINDRGPYIAGRSLDLSAAAARAIGLDRAGVGRVSIQTLR